MWSKTWDSLCRRKSLNVPRILSGKERRLKRGDGTGPIICIMSGLKNWLGNNYSLFFLHSTGTSYHVQSKWSYFSASMWLRFRAHCCRMKTRNRKSRRLSNCVYFGTSVKQALTLYIWGNVIGSWWSHRINLEVHSWHIHHVNAA